MNDEVTLRAEVMELLNSMAEPFDLNVPADIELWRSRAEANQALAREALRMALDTAPPTAHVEAERAVMTELMHCTEPMTNIYGECCWCYSVAEEPSEHGDDCRWRKAYEQAVALLRLAPETGVEQ